jgi:3-oxoacyl-[acyl-carrier-protein] synthase-3
MNAGPVAPSRPGFLLPPHTAAAGATITGTGMALPPRRMTNADLEKLVDTSDEWIIQRTGIKARYVSDNGLSTSDLAAQAVRQALAAAAIQPGDLDLLICATMTQDMICPATGCQVVAKLGAVPCGAFDLNAACSGFVTALNLAAALMRTGAYRHIAVVGAEQLSRIVNWKDRNTCVLFGDAAGAAIVSRTSDPSQGCLYQSMNSDGGRWADLYVPRHDRQIPHAGAFNGELDKLQMNGREVFKFAVNTFQKMLEDAIAACGLGKDQIKVIIPHQSNIRILSAAREKLGFSEDKLYINLDRYGNTSAASVALCLHELMEARRIGAGDTVIFIGLGGGLTWASSVWRL